MFRNASQKDGGRCRVGNHVLPAAGLSPRAACLVMRRPAPSLGRPRLPAPLPGSSALACGYRRFARRPVWQPAVTAAASLRRLWAPYAPAAHRSRGDRVPKRLVKETTSFMRGRARVYQPARHKSHRSYTKRGATDGVRRQAHRRDAQGARLEPGGAGAAHRGEQAAGHPLRVTRHREHARAQARAALRGTRLLGGRAAGRLRQPPCTTSSQKGGFQCHEVPP